MDFGEIYKYSEGHTFHEADANFKIIEFDLLKISENCVLAKYKVQYGHIMINTGKLFFIKEL